MSVRKFKVGMAAVLILGIVALFVIVGGGLAQGPALPPGEYDLETGKYVFNVLGADTPIPPTDVPPTDTPPTNTPEPSHPVGWHSPELHEHGDAAPQWVLDSPMQLRSFGGEGHPGFKGFHFIDYVCCDSTVGTGVEAYILPHIISVPKARLTSFHSYQAWLLDTSGNVSYWQGKLFIGDPPNVRPISLGDDGSRPVVFCVDQATVDNTNNRGEQWYPGSPRGAPGVPWRISNANYLCDVPESPDPATWVELGGLGNSRNQVEFIMYRAYVPIFDEVYCVGVQDVSNPQGDIVDCSTVGAAENFVHSTIPQGDGSSGQIFIRQVRTYPCPDCEIPN